MQRRGVMLMIVEQATAVRKEWSSVCDSVVREKPHFIKRTRDELILSSYETMLSLLRGYHFTVSKCKESDGSISLSLHEMDIVVNGTTIELAKEQMGEAILEYAEEYYENFAFYSHAPNRKDHVPYVMKALLLRDGESIGREIVCA